MTSKWVTHRVGAISKAAREDGWRLNSDTNNKDTQHRDTMAHWRRHNNVSLQGPMTELSIFRRFFRQNSGPWPLAWLPDISSAPQASLQFGQKGVNPYVNALQPASSLPPACLQPASSLPPACLQQPASSLPPICPKRCKSVRLRATPCFRYYKSHVSSSRQNTSPCGQKTCPNDKGRFLTFYRS